MSRHSVEAPCDVPVLGSSIRRAVVAVALCCTAVGCQSQSSPGSAPGGSSGPDPTQGAKRMDACSMLSPQDISSLLGATVQGKPTTHSVVRSGCTWEDKTSEESVTLELGTPGSAPHNTLAAPLPGFPEKTGPDGMRYIDFGAVKFAGGNRENTVQVAVIRLTPDQRNAAAVDLARKIVPQLSQ
jgi:hypothetical protein